MSLGEEIAVGAICEGFNPRGDSAVAVSSPDSKIIPKLEFPFQNNQHVLSSFPSILHIQK